MSEDTIASVIRAQGRLGDRVFVTADADRLTYGAAELRSRKLASALMDEGIGRGSRVAMLFGNSTDFAVCFLALSRIGAIAMPISTLSTAPEIGGMLANADAEFFIATPSYRGRDLREVGAAAVDRDLAGTLLLPRLPILRRLWFGTYSIWPLDRDMPENKWGSIGKPLSGMKVRIADPDSGEILAPGETGSVQLGGHNILRGICGREREEVFTRDGWYDAGDMGSLDVDGFLWFAGRRDDMVKISGATVYPSEVEAALQAIPGVARAFATDLLVNGRLTIGAAVILEKGIALDEASLAASAKERLSAFKVPSRWKILGSLDGVPRNASDKVDKAGLQALLLG